MSMCIENKFQSSTVYLNYGTYYNMRPEVPNNDKDKLNVN